MILKKTKGLLNSVVKFMIILTPYMFVPDLSFCQSLRASQFNELSVDYTREFTEKTVQDENSFSRKMMLFEMPEEFQCPLFSDSPYMEVLGAIDLMQNQLNTVIPSCDNKELNTQISQKASQLRDQIFKAQKLQEQGQTFQFNLSTQNIIQLTQQLQQVLLQVAQSQTKVCYKSNQQFRNVVFSMNETFQSLAPVVLDFVKLNPVLATSMGPALKILTGADHISKGISFIEQIIKESVLFDMTDKDNRVNTIKNVCQFMKLYRRVQYLRLSKLGQVQVIHSEFQEKIGKMKLNLDQIKNHSPKKLMDSTGGQGVKPVTMNQALSSQNLKNSVTTDPTFDLYEVLTKSIPLSLMRVQKSLADIESASQQYNDPLLPQCQTVLTTRRNTNVKQTLSQILEFYKIYGDITEVESLYESLNDYSNDFIEIEKEKEKRMCVDAGQDWLKIVNQVLHEGRKLILRYEVSMEESIGSSYLNEKKRIAKKEKEIQNEKSNFESLKALINVAAFESAELEKRFKDMHRFLFKGPDFNEVRSSCDDSPDSTVNCSLGSVKAAYQWYRNNGPIYELLKNDEKYFDLEVKKINESIQAILQYEQKHLQKQNGGKLPSERKQFHAFIQKSYELSNVNSKNLIKNSSEHTQICRQSNIAFNSYMKATGFLSSSESLCNMIYPALDAETQVSPLLLGFCQPTKGVPSKIQSQIIELVGSSTPQNQVQDLYKNNFNNSIKSFVDKLIEKYNDLGCEQKSGIF